MPAKKEPDSNIERKVVENLVQLQKVEANLAEKLNNVANKLNNLTSQISRLLSLFEEAAKAFAKNPPPSSINRETSEKIDKLVEQNKVLAKGLSLMEEKIRGKISSSPEESLYSSRQPKF